MKSKDMLDFGHLQVRFHHYILVRRVYIALRIHIKQRELRYTDRLSRLDLWSFYRE
ncbi:hypothetical protein LINPERHAP1_LOCUS28745 [Linum perenne]